MVKPNRRGSIYMYLSMYRFYIILLCIFQTFSHRKRKWKLYTKNLKCLNKWGVPVPLTAMLKSILKFFCYSRWLTKRFTRKHWHFKRYLFYKSNIHRLEYTHQSFKGQWIKIHCSLLIMLISIIKILGQALLCQISFKDW